MEERSQQRKEERARRDEAKRRESEALRKAGKEGVRKHIEQTRKRLEACQPDKMEERKGNAKGTGARPLPVYVTVKGTISRFNTLMLLGYGKLYSVPVLKNVTVTANP